MLLCVAATLPVWGQSPAPENDVYRIGAGVLPPKLLRRVEPAYTPEARQAYIQGTVVFEIVVDPNGLPTDINLISPLGFGLDEEAQAAIQQWRFQPGSKDGKPVNVRATIEVNFRFRDIWFDKKAEERRTAFNEALRNVKLPEPKTQARAVETIARLSNENFPPAMHLQAIWMREGKLVPLDKEQSLALLTQAAAKKYGPAMYELGKLYIENTGNPSDAPKGMKLIQDAASLGSIRAQFYLGARYEKGEEAGRDPDRARRYFRLCAAAREPACQFRLGRMLISDRARADDYVQGLAWLDLAAEQGSAPAIALLDAERPKLTIMQTQLADRLKMQIDRKPR